MVVKQLRYLTTLLKKKMCCIKKARVHNAVVSKQYFFFQKIIYMGTHKSVRATLKK